MATNDFDENDRRDELHSEPNLINVLSDPDLDPKRKLTHFNSRCEPLDNCFDCRSRDEGSICVWDSIGKKCMALEQQFPTNYWFDYLRDCKDVKSLCDQQYDEEMQQYTFRFKTLQQGTALIPKNYFCQFEVSLTSETDTEWEIAIGTRNSSSRSIKVDLESSTEAITRSLQWRKDFNSSPEIQNSTRRMSFTKRSLGDFGETVRI